jgi:hypothetical protein
MKKLIYFLIISLTISIITIVSFLSFLGYETDKFNNLIISQLSKYDKNTKVNIEKIRIKIDLKNFNLFIVTKNLEIIYQNVSIPVEDIKLYFSLFSLIKSNPELSRIILNVKEIDTKKLQKILVGIKPSNFKSYLLNNVENGRLTKSYLDLNFNEDFKVINYEIIGSIEKVNILIKKDISLKNVNFNFSAHKDLILINSIQAHYQGIDINKGTIEIKKKKRMIVKGSFNSKLNLNKLKLEKLTPSFKFDKLKKILIDSNSTNKFELELSDTLELLDYKINFNSNLSGSKIIFNEDFKNSVLENSISLIEFSKTNLNVDLNKKKDNFFIIKGLYKTNNSKPSSFEIKNNFKKDNSKYQINIDLNENIFIKFINFKNDIKKKNNIKSSFTIKKKKILINNLDFIENKNLISIKGIKINKKNQLEKFDTIKVVTFNDNRENNNFQIGFKKKRIIIEGKKYDGFFLSELINSKNQSSYLKNINKEIKIKIEEVITKSLKPLKNFNLLGEIERGKFTKISAKGDFGNDKYLDISLKTISKNQKILEIYSDYPTSLLAEYKFFDGLKDGKLIYTSNISKDSSKSKLIIENFKVIKAPAFATLLTLADLGGVADLLSGKGISFDSLEIIISDDSITTNIEEVLAVGPSLSVLMDGYIESETKLISFSGTMVPAKNLNQLISKIPVVGNILVGKKTGEGVFGVSFKIKGLPGKVKTTVNPVKTLTPRFITRALEKRREKAK